MRVERAKKPGRSVVFTYSVCVCVCSYAVNPHTHTVNNPLLKDSLSVGSFLALL